MICRRRRRDKKQVRFAKPPWDRRSPQWIALDEELPENHFARAIVAAVAELDLTPLLQSYSASGSMPHRPDLMLAMVFVEIHQGKRSPSQWCRDSWENRVMQWVGFGMRPSRSCWYEFRDRVACLVNGWNAQVLHAAREQEITPAQRAALDGSTVAANASRHRLLSESRLQKRIGELEGAIDGDEMGSSVKPVPAWMAKTPATRVAQYAKYRLAGQHLEVLLQANQQRSPSERRPRKRVVVSPSDPEAALGRDKLNVFRPLYNVQVVHDLDSPLVLGYEVFSQATDAVTLGPMIERTAALTGVALEKLVVDAGYVTGCDLAVCERAAVTLYGPWKENDYTAGKSSSKGIARIGKDQFQWLPEAGTYRCPQGNVLRPSGRETRRRAGGRTEKYSRYVCPMAHCRACPVRSSCTTGAKQGRILRRSEHEERIEVHRARMETVEAKTLYKLRAPTVERIFADIKEHRQLRRFSGRGLRRCRTELGLTVLVHNLQATARVPPPIQTPCLYTLQPP